MNELLLSLNNGPAQVFIDSNGDAEGNYTVVSMLPLDSSGSGRAQDDPLHRSTGRNYAMQPVGYFQYNATSTSPSDLPVS